MSWFCIPTILFHAFCFNVFLRIIIFVPQHLKRLISRIKLQGLELLINTHIFPVHKPPTLIKHNETASLALSEGNGVSFLPPPRLEALFSIFSFLLVCLQKYTNTTEKISSRLGRRTGLCPRINPINFFCEDQDKGIDPGVIFSLALA